MTSAPGTQNGQAAFRAENAKSDDNRARRKRRDRETSQGCGADTRKTGARVDDLPDQFSFAKRNERCLARNRTLAVQGQGQRRACNKFERFRGCPYHWLPPYQAPPRCPQRTLCKHHVQSSSVELFDQRRTQTDLDLKLHIRVRAGKPTECRRQRTTRNFFDCSKAHGAGKRRRGKAAASRLFQLQQAARVT